MSAYVIPVLLCGGAGQRLKPLSTTDDPKQFLPLNKNGKSLYQLTLARALRACPFSIPRIVTTAALEPVARSQTTAGVDYITEPLRRNTAAAIAQAALRAHKDDLLWIMPCDHLIDHEDKLQKALYEAADLEKKKNIVTLGIKPTQAHTGYGYIKPCDNRVETFLEKPNAITAQQYFNSGQYYWNSGMIVARAKTIVDAFLLYAPEYASNISYASLPALPFDKVILEHARNLLMVRADDMGWRDIGQPEDLAHIEKTLQTN